MAGYFASDSMVRRVTGETIVAFSGPRALLMMAAHPVAFTGFFAHSGALSDPYARLRRTGEVLDTIVWGSDRASADRATAAVRRAHRRVHGRLTEPAGRFPAGTSYRADDPELLLWILASLADSAVLVYERYVRRLSDRERDALWADYRVIGAQFGLQSSDMPATWHAFRLYVDRTVSSDELFVTRLAREFATKIVLDPPVPRHARPLLLAVNQLTTGLLPTELRRQYRLCWDPARALALAGGAEYIRHVLPIIPPRIRLIPHARAAPAGAG